MRSGGDEFVCTLAATDLEAAQGRFFAVQAALTAKQEGASISVGFAVLQDGDTFQELMDRGDAALHAVQHPN
jgi:GGDEF domain-containing protein